MRPLPTDSRLFIPPSGRHGTRPWWVAGARTGEAGWTRIDGWSIMDNGYHFYSSQPIALSILDEGTPEGSSYDEVMAVIDTENPLPAPELRAGQVWLLETRNAQTTALLNSTLDGFLRVGRDAFAPSKGRLAWASNQGGMGMVSPTLNESDRARHQTLSYPGWVIGGRFLTQSEASDLLLRDGNPDICAFLIADPVYPLGVPWTGSQRIGWAE